LPNSNLSSRRRRLADGLRQLRDAAGVSGRQMAADLGWSQPKISRAERGLHVLSIDDIRRWLDFCKASEQQKHDLLMLADDVATEVATFRDLNRGGHAAQQRQRIVHDAEADAIMIYQPEVVPGLLQTPQYTRLLLLAIDAATPENVGESVAARMERQSVLYDEYKKIDAVITETALAWQPGPASVSREQLDRIRTLAALPNLNIGIVAREQQKHAPTSNSFVITHWPDGGIDVVTESLTAEVTITDETDVAIYQAMFKRQQEHAVYGDEASALLTRVASGLD
jgi:transcriptional regulator with XRE-family HTH domain